MKVGEALTQTATVSFSMPKGSKLKADMPMTVDETMSVTVTGKVTSISDDKWGKNFSMEPESIKCSHDKKSTMSDEMRKMKNGRKYKQGNEDEDDGR